MKDFKLKKIIDKILVTDYVLIDNNLNFIEKKDFKNEKNIFKIKSDIIERFDDDFSKKLDFIKKDKNHYIKIWLEFNNDLNLCTSIVSIVEV